MSTQGNLNAPSEQERTPFLVISIGIPLLRVRGQGAEPNQGGSRGEQGEASLIKRLILLFCCALFSVSLWHRGPLSSAINQADLPCRQPAASCSYDKMDLTSFATDHPLFTDFGLFG